MTSLWKKTYYKIIKKEFEDIVYLNINLCKPKFIQTKESFSLNS